MRTSAYATSESLTSDSDRQAEAGRARVVHKHLYCVQAVLVEVFAQERELFQKIVRHRDDVAADRVRLHDIKQFARACPNQLDLRTAANTFQGAAHYRKRIATGV